MKEIEALLYELMNTHNKVMLTDQIIDGVIKYMRENNNVKKNKEIKLDWCTNDAELVLFYFTNIKNHNENVLFDLRESSMLLRVVRSTNINILNLIRNTTEKTIDYLKAAKYIGSFSEKLLSWILDDDTLTCDDTINISYRLSTFNCFTNDCSILYNYMIAKKLFPLSMIN